MSRAVMQEFLRGKPNGAATVFEGDDFMDVTGNVFAEAFDTMAPRMAIRFMVKWLQGEPYAKSLGSFNVREYETTPGVWYEWTYTD